MMLEVYSVYDKAVGAYMPPFFVRARGEALRSFMAACTNNGHEFSKNPSDFTLFYLGRFQDDSGLVDTGLGPERVISALECVKTVEATVG